MPSQVKLNIDGTDYLCTPIQPEPIEKMILGWKSDINEQEMVKQIGSREFSTSRWPGSKLGGAILAGLLCMPRYQLETQGTKTCLMPLKTSADISSMEIKASGDADAYKAAGCLAVAINNEPDARVSKTDSRPRFWGGTMLEFGPTWAKHIVPIFRARGLKIVWELPQTDTINIIPYLDGLVNSGAYLDGDHVSFHAYQSTAEGHISRWENAMSFVRQVLGQDFPWDRMESTEWGIARGGGDPDRLVELEKLWMKTLALGVKRVFHYRIAYELEHPQGYNSPFNDDGSPRFSYSFWRGKVAA